MIFNKEERTYWIENYKKFPTSNISDAMDNLGLRSGIVLGLRPLDVYQPRTAGFAKTLRQMRRKTAFDGKSLTKQASIIDSQTEYGDLLVIEATGLTDVATGGAMLATRAQMRGVMGELTNGSLRDIDEIGKWDFPVYCTGTTPGGPYKEGPGEVNVPVSCGGISVNPGDIILADPDGVIVIPRKDAPQILEDAKKFQAADESKLVAAKNGTAKREWVEKTLAAKEFEIIDDVYEP